MEDTDAPKTDLEKTTEVQRQRAEVVKDPEPPGWFESLRNSIMARLKNEPREPVKETDSHKVYAEFETGTAYDGGQMTCTTIASGNAKILQGFKFDANGQLNGVVVEREWLGKWEEEVTEGPMAPSPELKKRFEALGGSVSAKVGYEGPVKVSLLVMTRNNQGTWDVKENIRKPNRLEAWSKEFQPAQARLDTAGQTPQPIATPK